MKLFKQNIKTHKFKKGFTLVELLVTISMFVIITGVVLVNSNQFDNTILLNNFAYDVALTVKQAQSYGVNVRESVAGAFDSYYGVYFDKRANIGSNTSFALFDYTPLNPNGPIDLSILSGIDIKQSCSAYPDNCLQKYTMRRGIYIKNICSGENESTCSYYDRLIVMFKRPSLSAKIFAFNGTDTPQLMNYVKINLSSPSNASSSIVITSAGQIYVKK